MVRVVWREGRVGTKVLRERKHILFREWREIVNDWSHIVERRKNDGEKEGRKKRKVK